MFEGGFPEQFHHFMIASSTPPPPPSSSLALSFPLQAPPSPLPQATFPITAPPYPSSHSSAPLLLHLQPQLDLDLDVLPHKHDEKQQQQVMMINASSAASGLELGRDRGSGIPDQLLFDPWTNDEVLALLRIRSSIEYWLPDFTWEHVSRKLGELGYRRSGESCKQKFEEESRHFDNMSTSSYTMKSHYTRPFFSELEEFCHGENSSQVLVERNQNVVQKLPSEEGEVENVEQQQISLVQDSRNEVLRENDQKKSESKKRKRHGHHRRKFELLKGFCEDILNKMIAQQEELHNKIIEDMLKREEEKIAREEAWKKQEIERIHKEVEIRAHEQDRQTKLIEVLKNFTSTISSPDQNQSSGRRTRDDNENSAKIAKGGTASFSSTSCSLIQPHNPNPTSQPSDTQNPSFAATLKENPNGIMENENPSLAGAGINLANDKSAPRKRNIAAVVVEKEMKEDLGKRWPRDEVLALINLRCSSHTSNEDKESGVPKGPLWERISQGMLELGYKRSAKRCKEKWENINKYFRKTKDVNKKRSVDSRTCPYFHQLNTLYAQGTSLVHLAPLGRDDGRENPSPTAEASSEV
ncbi:hypothetical protein RHSIM_Rhsim10G0109000 [Rhododendron simsii]|uniref:Myb-like domain-containing protein n=1 Tax=Rhododendron simsii TaxID=118357 RepID=A0A834GF55_RHOSS|nr:hypothetical protein RHSIM_Rhsim10G0109000 [Rhododendron simsii]